MKQDATMPRPRQRRTNQESQSQIDDSATAMAASSVPNELDGLAIELSHEEIANRAYQLYEARGGEHGHDLQDWFQAERELREFLRGAVETILKADGFYAAV